MTTSTQMLRGAVLGAGLLLAACVPLGQYRNSQLAGSEAACQPASPASVCPSVIVQEKPDYLLGILEFDDQGSLYSRQQIDFVLQQLSQGGTASGAHEGRILIVFAHGWFHNAAPGDRNLAFFREMLARTATVEEARAKTESRRPRLVEGVFLSWRGASSEVPLLKLATFWNRKDAAHRIGERQATEALLRLRELAYAGPEPANPNRFIVMGHSFGGALVYSAISQLIANELLAARHDGGKETRLADAMILFNPAFEAARVQHLFETAAVLGPRYPKLAIFTSRSDRATGVAFPAARFINTLLLSYRDDGPNPLRPGETLQQRTEDTRTIGHYKPFLTHELVPATADGSNGCRERPELVMPKMPEGAADQPQQQREIAKVAQMAQQQLSDAYNDNATTRLEFGRSCLKILPGLVHKQLAVFNVAIDSALWDGHGIEQTPERADVLLGFLQKFIPFAASGEPEEEEVLMERGLGAMPPPPAPAAKALPPRKF